MEKVPFYSSELDRSNLNPSAEILRDTIDLLNNARLHEEILAGNVTLAMIRPAVGPDANNKGLDDTEAAWEIEKMISELGMLAKFSFLFTPQSAEVFYQGGPQESMSKEPPRNPEEYSARWPEFVDFMSSRATTALLLYSPDGNAIPLWRRHLGHWNIDEVRDMSTIRGQLGVNKYNNLVHGSDAPEAVMREIGIISSILQGDLENL